MNEPLNLLETVFELQAQGYQPVLAHPERYTYWYGRFEQLMKLRRDYGVLMQLNINSITGYYSPAAQKVAEQLIDGGLVDFVGTDAHHPRHIQMLRRSTQLPYLRKLLELPLLNASLAAAG